jgi:hypothetical protein
VYLAERKMQRNKSCNAINSRTSTTRGSNPGGGEIFRTRPDGEERVASRGQEIVSVASQGVRFTYYQLRPGFQPQAYELRPAVNKVLL